MSLLKRRKGGQSGEILHDASFYIEQGNRHISEKDWQAALADFDKAVELSSTPADRVAALFNRGRAYSRLKRLDDAIADYDRVAILAPTFGLTYLERGGCFGIKGDNLAAIADCDRAIALFPPGINQAIAYCNRGVAYDALGNYQAALSDINWAIEIAPEFTPAYSEKERVLKRALEAGGRADA